MEVSLDQPRVYLPYENRDSEHLVAHLISNGHFIYTILIQFSLNFKNECKSNLIILGSYNLQCINVQVVKDSIRQIDDVV